MTEAELLQAVHDALARSEDPEDFYTTEDWCEMFGLAGDATRRRLKKLLKTGHIERGKVIRETMAGVDTPVVAYKFLP